MDPISIISLAGAVSQGVYQVSTTLYMFIQATKNVDQSIKSLHAEVDGLHRVLDAISSSLTDPTIKSTMTAAQDSSKLWSAFEGSLSDCRETIQALDIILKNVKGGSTRRNIFTLSIRQMKLNLNDDGIKTFRSQIQTHTVNLQMALQMINVHVSCISPNRVIDDISPKIERLAEMVAKFQLPQTKESESRLPTQINSDGLLRHTKSLKQSAEAVISSASTVLGAESVDGGDRERNLTAGSEYGEPLSDANRNMIETWIPQPNIVEEPMGGDKGSSAAQSHKQETISSIPNLDASVERNFVGGEANLEEFGESDSDDDTDFEGVQGFLAKGIEEYNRSSFVESEQILRHGLKIAQKLSFKRRALLNLMDIRLKIALSCLQQGKLDESEQILLTIEQEQAANDQDAAQILLASYTLADVYCRKGNLDKAEAYCRKSMIGRRRNLGKQHPDYYGSLKLLVSIYRAKDDQYSAAIYADLIPAEFSDAKHPVAISIRSLNKGTEESKNSKLKLSQEEKEMALEILLRHGYRTDGRGFDASKTLVWASQEGHDSVVQLLLEEGAVIDTKDNDGFTALHKASSKGNKAAVQLLLEKGAAVDTQSRDGQSALYCAARNGNEEIIRLLLENGANIDMKTKYGWTPLQKASLDGFEVVVQILLEKGATTNIQSSDSQSPIYCAVRNGSGKIVQLLLEHGANTDVKMCGWTPLQKASIDGHEGVVRLLLEKGADVNTQSNDGQSAIYCAAKNGFEKVVRLLLDHGVDINVKTKSGLTPLQAASSSGHEAVAQLLVERGALTNGQEDLPAP